MQGLAYGQTQESRDSLKADSSHKKAIKKQYIANNINKQYDFGDLTRNLLHPRRKADTIKKRSGIIVVPNIAANPTIGAQLGIKAVAGRRLGNDPNTFLSVAATSASITSKGIIYFYVNHNIFTPGNKWNFQGNIVAAILQEAALRTIFWLIQNIKFTPFTPCITILEKKRIRKWQKICF